MASNDNICEICENPVDTCICCAECGHVCSLDLGELYCTVCFPKKNGIQSDEHFMRIALKEAESAFMEGEVPVGAVLVKDDGLIAAAHNKKEATSDPTAHAELSVIREGAIKLGNWRLSGATLYVTKEPCVMCAGAMVNARLSRLVYGCRDERFGAVNSRYQLLHDAGLNHRIRVVSGVVEEECTEILKKFFKVRR